MTPSDMIRPRALHAGARIALVAPGGPLEGNRIEQSARLCRSLGLEPIVFPSAEHRLGYLAGADHERLQDLQSALDDSAIDGIWALRGGYGTLRLLDRLDLSRQRSAPVPFIGFSDNTTIHVRHQAIRTISFHGPHPGADFPPETEEAFRRVLFSADPPGPLVTRPGDPRPRPLVSGRVEARLTGGNLSLLAALCGSLYTPDATGRILFLEDVSEPAYRIDRALLQLERAGVLDGVVGLAFGRFTQVPDAEEHPIEDVLAEFAQHIGVPTVIDLPFGHTEHNCTLPVGGLARLDANDARLTLVEGAVVER